MSLRIIVLTAFIGVLAFGSGLYAEVELDISGQIRFRTEIDDKSFDKDATTKEYSLLRSRIMVEASIGENAKAVIQLQDSRQIGGDSQSGTLTNTDNVDVHQSYLVIDQLWENGPGLQAGRFELNLSNQRIFGAVGWHNVGRSWEGLRLWLERENFKAAGFWLKKNELNFDEYNGDFNIFGMNVEIPEYGIDILGFYEHDGFRPDTTINPGEIDEATFVSDVRNLKRFNIGAFGKWTRDAFDFESNINFQFGTQPMWTEPFIDVLEAVEADISAFMFAFRGGYKFAGPSNVYIAAGVDYTSGDDEMDDKNKSYNNLYYTGHKFRGYMDYFLGSDVPGLVDIILHGKFDPTTGWTVNGDFHYFQRAADYIDFNSEKTKDVGMELDVTVTTKRVSGLNLVNGASIFIPKESFAGYEDPDPTLWAYSMLTVNF